MFFGLNRAYKKMFTFKIVTILLSAKKVNHCNLPYTVYSEDLPNFNKCNIDRAPLELRTL